MRKNYSHKISDKWKIDSYIDLNDFEEVYFNSLFSIEPEYYENYLRKIGFTNKKKVLDIGCGMGAWTISLSKLNDFAVGIDQRNDRLAIAQYIAKVNRLENCIFEYGNIEKKMQYSNKEFDAIFCNSVLNYINKKKLKAILKNFNRVLDKKGRIFIRVVTIKGCINKIRYAFIKRKFNMMLQPIEMLRNTLCGKESAIAFNEKYVKQEMENAGFQIIKANYNIIQSYQNTVHTHLEILAQKK